MIALADLVRAMNCYYSKLIEGHDTRDRESPDVVAISGANGLKDGLHSRLVI